MRSFLIAVAWVGSLFLVGCATSEPWVVSYSEIVRDVGSVRDLTVASDRATFVLALSDESGEADEAHRAGSGPSGPVDFPTRGVPIYPQLLTGDGEVHALWAEESPPGSESNTLVVRYSVLRGLNWSAPVTVIEGRRGDWIPGRVATWREGSGRLHIVLARWRSAPERRILHLFLSDGRWAVREIGEGFADLVSIDGAERGPTVLALFDNRVGGGSGLVEFQFDERTSEWSAGRAHARRTEGITRGLVASSWQNRLEIVTAEDSPGDAITPRTTEFRSWRSFSNEHSAPEPCRDPDAVVVIAWAAAAGPRGLVVATISLLSETEVAVRVGTLADCRFETLTLLDHPESVPLGVALTQVSAAGVDRTCVHLALVSASEGNRQLRVVGSCR